VKRTALIVTLASVSAISALANRGIGLQDAGAL
jgi:hypothetical protein